MGIRGLTSYTESVGSLWSKIQIKETKVIIDGSSLMWHLYLSEGIDYQHGGNYDHQADAIAHFFKALESSKVEPYVIIDGPTVARDKKLERIKERFERDIESSYRLSTGYGGRDCSLLPLMSKRVFIQELRNLGVSFVVCDCEADQEVASLASHWNCPAISNDSDYYIFDLPAGYVPLKYLDWKGNSISGKLYKRQRLAEHLQIRPEFLPLVASLVGNDFIEESTLAPFERGLSAGRGVSKKITTIAGLFSTSNNLEEALECALKMVPGGNHKRRLRSALEESMKEYSIYNYTLDEFFELKEIRTSLKTLASDDISSLFIQRYRNGVFPVKYMGVLTSGRHLLTVQVEKPTEASARDCSCDLRRAIYGIIMKPPQGHESAKKGVVKEWSRNGRSIKKSHIQPLWGPVPGYGELPKLDDLDGIEMSERQRMLLIILQSNVDSVKSLEARFRLFAASVRYWIHNAKPKVRPIWVQTLVLVHLRLLAERDKSPSPNSSDVKKSPRSDFDIDRQHSFAQWQAVMFETISLNRILLDPFDEPRLSTLYNGVMAQSIVCEIKQDKEAESFVRTSDIFAAVTEGTWLDPRQEKGNSVQNAEARSEQTVRKRDKKPPKVLKGNPFASLCDEESGDESEDEP